MTQKLEFTLNCYSDPENPEDTLITLDRADPDNLDLGFSSMPLVARQLHRLLDGVLTDWSNSRHDTHVGETRIAPEQAMELLRAKQKAPPPASAFDVA